MVIQHYVFVAKYEQCIQSSFTILQEELPGTGHASVIMEHVLDPSNISDMQNCNGTRLQISFLLKSLLMKGEAACKELFRVVETDLKKVELIQQMIDRNYEIKKRGMFSIKRARGICNMQGFFLTH